MTKITKEAEEKFEFLTKLHKFLEIELPTAENLDDDLHRKRATLRMLEIVPELSNQTRSNVKQRRDWTVSRRV